MIEWSDTDLMVRDSVRQFVDKEVRPHLDELKSGAMSPYPIARKLFPLGARIDDEPWMGCRPCTPDMMPIIGPAVRHKDLWFAFGHAHHGLTLGPITGRMIAEMMTGSDLTVDPSPFRVDRF